MKQSEKKRHYMKLIVLVTILLVSAVFAGINNWYLQEKPFHKEFMMDYPSGSTAGANGDLYVIDKSKQRIAAFSQNGTYLFEILGGNRTEKSFYAADDLQVDQAGNVYVVDVVLSMEGSMIEKERIVKFDRKGKYVSTIYEVVYETGRGPLTTGRIQGLSLIHI